MQYLVVKEKKKRKKLVKQEAKYLILKSILANGYIGDELKNKASLELKKIGAKGFSTVQNRCIVSGRSKGLIRDYKISRMVFKFKASRGLIRGLKKGR